MFGVIKINQDAPNFSLDGVLNKKVQKYELKDFTSNWLLLFFYRADFKKSSGEEILELNKLYPEFKNKNCEVVGISTDSTLSHTYWTESLKQNINFPLLSDKHHAACIDYNIFEDETAQPFSSTFLISPDKKLKWIQICNHSTRIDFDYALKVVEQSNSK
jgi:alkyl hydroperoxide reductase subunit AhpC